jgi:hypothetical protein
MLLSVLAFAVVGMHSLVADGATPESTAPPVMAHPPAVTILAEPSAEPGCCDDHDTGHVPGHSHDLQHLCLAILIAVGVLIGGSLLWRCRRAPLARREPSSPVPGAGRGPPSVRISRDLLSSLCILRL